jgi:hypothetical protein
MSVSTPLPVLAADQVLTALRTMRERQPVKFSAFYSSQLGGIVTDPALMVLPFDDHMVHRGHGIFDTAGLVAGRIYDLEAHLDRFLGSAERSRLKLAGSRAEMRDIIIRTTAASGVRDGAIRYWLSSGPGNLDLTPAAGRDARLLRHRLRRPRLSRAVVLRRPQGDDDDVSDQAAALRHHQGHELPAERPDADGGEGGGTRQRSLHRREGFVGESFQHERGVRDERMASCVIRASFTSSPAARRCVCSNWHRSSTAADS